MTALVKARTHVNFGTVEEPGTLTSASIDTSATRALRVRAVLSTAVGLPREARLLVRLVADEPHGSIGSGYTLAEVDLLAVEGGKWVQDFDPVFHAAVRVVAVSSGHISPLGSLQVEVHRVDDAPEPV